MKSFIQITGNYQINITLHIFILFTFLTIFFFTFLSKVETENINNVTKDLIKSQTSIILSDINVNIPNVTPDITHDKIDLNKLADNLENSSKKDIPEFILNDSEYVGVRCLINQNISKVISKLDGPITTTSLNRSGESVVKNLNEVQDFIDQSSLREGEYLLINEKDYLSTVSQQMLHKCLPL